MFFSEYCRILQNNYKITIDNEGLCKTLFDFVIIPADLRDSKNKLSHMFVSPSVISKILNHSAPIYKQIRDHIYDYRVTEKLVKNFDEVIVPELKPEKHDLCFQMMEIINSDNISPITKNKYKKLAKPNTIAEFLAEVFVYAVSTNGSTSKTIDNNQLTSNMSFAKEPVLILKGIRNNKRISENVLEESLLKKLPFSIDKIIKKTKSLYREVSEIHLPKPSPKTSVFGSGFDFFKKYNIDDDQKEALNSFANHLKIKLPEDFFDLGGLYLNPFGGTNSYGIPVSVPEGTPDELKKYDLMCKIEFLIKKYAIISPFVESFKNIKCISLALLNNGTVYDEDVRITLHFNTSDILTPKEISLFDQRAVDFLVNECDFEEFFCIPKGIDYLAYSESKKERTHSTSASDSSISFFSNNNSLNYENEIQKMMGYSFIEDKTECIVEIIVDSINQHTSVAFPTLILLKNKIDKLQYTIKSKHNSRIVTGFLKVVSK